MANSIYKHEFSIKRQKGIHDVKMGKERVIVANNWSIEVPAGYSYCADYSLNPKDVKGELNYLLLIQKTDEKDFSVPYCSDVSIAVKESRIVINGYTNDARDCIEVMDQLATPLLGDVIFRNYKKDILVVCQQTEDSLGYPFMVMPAGDNCIYRGQVYLGAEMPDLSDSQKKDIVLSFIKSIKPVTNDELLILDKNMFARLDKSFYCDFERVKYAALGDCVRIPIPKGFKAVNDLNDQINMAIVPEDFDEYTDEIIDAKIALYMASPPMELPYYDKMTENEIVDGVIDDLKETLPGGFSQIYTIKRNDDGLICCECSPTQSCTRYINVAFVHYGDAGYVLGFIVNIGEPIGFKTRDEISWDVEWDVRQIMTAWLGRILFPGEKKPPKKEYITGKESEKKQKDDKKGKKTGKKSVSEYLEDNCTIPSSELYRHFDSKKNAGAGLAGLGATVIVNSSGTDYNFIPLDSFTEEADEDVKKACERILGCDTEPYDMGGKARNMSRLFHVSPDAFNTRSDRECEINQGLMESAYLMSALRSFAWSVLGYCKDQEVDISALGIDDVGKVVEYIAGCGWLNYDDRKNCETLCKGNDVHIFYIPDNASDDDRKVFMPDEEDYERVRTMKEKFLGYNEMLSDVQSLDGLRKDIISIYPAIEVLYNDLLKDRNYNEPLVGNEADILYSWCALAIAAEKPFFTEDGPMTCFFTQMDSEPASAIKTTKSGDAKAKKLESAELSHDISDSSDDELALFAILDYEKCRGKKVAKDSLLSDLRDNAGKFKDLKKNDFYKRIDAFRERLKDEAVCEEYSKQFKALPLNERYSYSSNTILSSENLSTFISNNYEFSKGVAFKDAITHTKKWYSDAEWPFIERELTKELFRFGHEIDKQLEEDGIFNIAGNYQDAKNRLEIEIGKHYSKKTTVTHGDVCYNSHKLELFLPQGNSRAVGFFRINSNLAWYWGVNPKDVWHQAYNNNVTVGYFGEADNPREVAKQAIDANCKLLDFEPEAYYDRNRVFADVGSFEDVEAAVKEKYGEVTGDTVKQYLDERDREEIERLEKEKKEKENAEKYEKLIGKSNVTSIQELQDMIESFKQLGDYKDAEQKAADYEQQLADTIRQKKERAISLEEKSTKEDIQRALDIYKELKGVKDDSELHKYANERTQQAEDLLKKETVYASISDPGDSSACEKMIEKVKSILGYKDADEKLEHLQKKLVELRENERIEEEKRKGNADIQKQIDSLNNEAGALEKELSELRGLFKKKKRLELEEQIAEKKSQIEELSKKFKN